MPERCCRVRPPEPKLGREGDFAMAAGAQQVNLDGRMHRGAHGTVECYPVARSHPGAPQGRVAGSRVSASSRKR
jgi:hypothetical protein